MKHLIKKFCLINLSFLMATSLLTTHTMHISAAQDNIAMGKSVFAMASTNGHNTDAITDGDVSTYWESGNDYNRWIEIDLDGIYDLTNIEVFTPVGEVSNYNIYISEDNNNYTKIATKLDDIKASEAGNSFVTNKPACKIRVDITYSSKFDSSRGNSSQVGYINEVKAYGTKRSGTSTPATPEIDIPDFKDSAYGERYQAMEKSADLKNSVILKQTSELVGRVIGDQYVSNFEFVLVPSTSGKDKFTLEDANGKIRISGPNGISLASGFNYYLKNVMHVNYDPIEGGKNIKLPETLTKIDKKVVKATPYEYKYLNNFCTPSYTYAFWNWDQYEPYLDWCAMNGVNLMLDYIGQEEVQRKTLKEFGYTDEDVKRYIPGPAYYAWFYMGNMSQFGGPLPNRWFVERTELGRKVHERMYIFGIDPVFVGFAGQVPEDFKKKNPTAPAIPQGGWCGFTRPPVIKTYVEGNEEDWFSRIAETFYESSEKTFGNITKYFAIDPFHEGGSKTWVDENGISHTLDETKISNAVQNKMIDYRSDAIWIVQNWQNNPTQKFLNGVNKSQTLVLDLYADNQPHYQTTLAGAAKPGYMMKDYDGTPWIWGMLHSFGGRMGFSGMPEVLTEEMPTQLKSNFMKGIGVTAESVATNPMLYEMIYDMGWENSPIDLDNYISNYFLSRYGEKSENIEEAWVLMRETAYHKRYDRQRAEDSIINAQPSLNATSASGYITAIIDYDKPTFEKILELYLKEYDKFKDNEAYQYDLADITRQVLQNASYEYLQEAKKAFNAKDAEKFKMNSDIFLNIIKLQDQVLRTTDEFSVGKWIQNARNLLPNADDWTKDLFEYNARAQITSWGPGQSFGSLKDYSNRQWSGLTGDYYYGRWSRYFEALNDSAKAGTWNQNPNMNWFANTYRWVNTKGNVSSEGKPFQIDKDPMLDLAALASTALRDFSVTKIDNNTPVEKGENVALGKPASATGSVVSGFPANNLTDGKTTTLWQNEDFTNASVTIDLGQIYDLKGIDIVFKTPEEDYHDAPTYAYKVEVLDDKGQWKVIEDKSNDVTIKDTMTPIEYAGYAQKIRVTIPKADMDYWDGFKPCLAEIRAYSTTPSQSESFKNIALNKTVTAQAEVNSTTRAAKNTVDGNDTTFWSAGAVIPAWIMVDLGSMEEVNNVTLLFEKGKTPQFGYKVEFLNDAKEVIATEDQLSDVGVKANKLVIPMSGEARFVRVTLTRSQSETANPALAELEVNQTNANIEPNHIDMGKAYGVTYSAQNETNNAKNVTDGNINTRWGAGVGTFPQYLQISAGKSVQIDNVNLVFGDNLMNRLEWKLEFYNELDKLIDTKTKTELLSYASLIQGTEGTNNAYHRLEYAYGKKATKIRYVVTGVKTPGDSAWAGLSEFEVLQASSDLIRTPGTEIQGVGGIEGSALDYIKDEDSNTFWEASREKQELILDFGKAIDVDRMIFMHRTSAALPYIISASMDGQSYETMKDHSQQKELNSKAIDTFGNSLTCRYLKITFTNKDLNAKISEVYIYPKDYTKQLMEITAKYQKAFAKFEAGDGATQVPHEIYDPIMAYFEDCKTHFENFVTLASIQELEATLVKNLNTLAEHKNFVDTQGLLTTIDDAEQLLHFLKDIPNVDEQKQTLTKAIEKAYVTYNTHRVTQQQLDQEIEVLRTVMKEINTVFIDELAAVIAEAQEIAKDKNSYTNSTWSPFEESLTYAQKLTTSDQLSVIKDAIQNLKESIKALVRKITDENLLSLQALVAKAEGLKDKYTVEVFAAVQKELDIIQEMLKDKDNMSDATAKDVLTKLTKAIDDLPTIEEDTTLAKSILKSAIDKANAAETSKQLDSLAPIVKQLILTTRDAAQFVYNDAHATNKQCIEAWLDLANALHFLDFKADKAALFELIKGCKEINTDDYKAGVEEFKAALATAQKVYDNANALQASIDEAYAGLEKARDGLVKADIVDKATLSAIISIIEQNVGNGDKYKKDENWKQFETALDTAKKVIANEDATQVDVNTAMFALTKAYENIRLLPSEEQLAQLTNFISIVSKLNRNVYSKDELKQIDVTTAKVNTMITDFDAKAFASVEKEIIEALKIINSVDIKNLDSASPSTKPGANAAKPNTGDSTFMIGTLTFMFISSALFVIIYRRKKGNQCR